MQFLTEAITRPQVFTSYLTGKSYDVRRCWEIAINQDPLEHRHIDLRGDNAKPDIDEEYAMALPEGSECLPVLCFTIPEGLEHAGEMHIIDGWHRMHRAKEKGYAIIMAVHVPLELLAEATFASTDEVAEHALREVRNNPSLMDHPAIRAAKHFGVSADDMKEIFLMCAAENPDRVAIFTRLHRCRISPMEFMHYAAQNSL